MKQICVIDGQGGGIGAAIIKKLREVMPEGSGASKKFEIIALGTNAIATAQMLKAHANRGASGENAIVRTVATAEMIIGPLGIVMAQALMGEVTPKMAEAVAGCGAKKILIPLFQESVEIVGLKTEPLPHLLEMMIEDYFKLVVS